MPAANSFDLEGCPGQLHSLDAPSHNCLLMLIFIVDAHFDYRWQEYSPGRRPVYPTLCTLTLKGTCENAAHSLPLSILLVCLSSRTEQTFHELTQRLTHLLLSVVDPSTAKPYYASLSPSSLALSFKCLSVSLVSRVPEKWLSKKLLAGVLRFYAPHPR